VLEGGRVDQLELALAVHGPRRDDERLGAADREDRRALDRYPCPERVVG
jgi:hypothetical protein